MYKYLEHGNLEETKLFELLATHIILEGAKKSTMYLSPTEVIKATFQGKRRKGASTNTILFTYGRPNYAERKFLTRFKKLKGTFPQGVVKS